MAAAGDLTCSLGRSQVSPNLVLLTVYARLGSPDFLLSFELHGSGGCVRISALLLTEYVPPGHAGLHSRSWRAQGEPGSREAQPEELQLHKHTVALPGGALTIWPRRLT
ncbi:hypothetical protein ElyMa_002659500 [Elysia marginata]|uniref:Uncharacterized protein n=1 Tax=Elysia marginata TaxID=1093978 RepID=A0AAV4HAK3_9GAST|nr:hypothetical protein ElyMa_002659500 [Elysia marginata]